MCLIIFKQRFTGEFSLSVIRYRSVYYVLFTIRILIFSLSAQVLVDYRVYDFRAKAGKTLCE